MGSWLIGGIAVLVILLGIQTDRVGKWKDKSQALTNENITLTDNYLTCETINAKNLVTINKQKESVAEFIAQRQALIEHANKLARTLAHSQAERAEVSRRAREEVQEILTGEACAAVEYPPRVRSLLNDAIAKASAGGSGDG